MKLNQVLSIVNQVDKSKFIISLDKLCFDAAKSNNKLTKTIDKIDGKIKSASGSEITHLKIIRINAKIGSSNSSLTLRLKLKSLVRH